MKKTMRGYRTLLNLPGHQTTAAVVAEIEDTRDWPEGMARNYEGELENLNRHNAEPECILQISDCDRSISFTFSWYSDDDLENNFYKVDQLHRAITEFRKALKDETRRLRKRRAEVAKAKADN